MKLLFCLLTATAAFAATNDHDSLDKQHTGWNEFCRERNLLLCDVNFRDPETPTNAELTLLHTHFMTYNGYTFQNLQSPGSKIEVRTRLRLTPSKTTYLGLDHCSTLINLVPLAHITIRVNGKEVISHFNAKNGGNFRQQHFDISDFVRNGENTIEVELDKDSPSRYWISTLCIFQK